MKLEDILLGLNADAGLLNKQASDESEGKTKDTKEDEAKKKDEGKGSGETGKTEDDKEQEKKASFKSAEDLAKEIMEKVASTQIEQTKGEEMNKQASEAGKALANALLTKLAGVGDVNTGNGIPAGVVPNKTQVDLAQQKAEHDAVIQATPGTDGAGQGGTINQIFDAIVADAQARTNAVSRLQSASAPAEGAVSAHQAPAQVPVLPPSAIGDDGQEKVAAVSALVSEGMDFDSAVELVKSAAQALEQEEDTLMKQAALGELIGKGIDFDLAVNMIRQLA